MKSLKYIGLSLAIVLGLGFSGCGDGSSGTTATVTGTFVDDPVQGLGYSCSSGTTGLTNALGQYTCNVGDDVTFRIGSVAIGPIAAQADIITPYSFFPNNFDAVLNLARLLQSIDQDGDPSNGLIMIDETLAAQLPSDTDFTNASFETLAEAVLGITLVSVTEAKAQLDDTIVQETNTTLLELGYTLEDFFVSNVGVYDVNITTDYESNSTSISTTTLIERAQVTQDPDYDTLKQYIGTDIVTSCQPFYGTYNVTYNISFEGGAGYTWFYMDIPISVLEGNQTWTYDPQDDHYANMSSISSAKSITIKGSYLWDDGREANISLSYFYRSSDTIFSIKTNYGIEATTYTTVEIQ